MSPEGGCRSRAGREPDRRPGRHRDGPPARRLAAGFRRRRTVWWQPARPARRPRSSVAPPRDGQGRRGRRSKRARRRRPGGRRGVRDPAPRTTHRRRAGRLVRPSPAIARPDPGRRPGPRSAAGSRGGPTTHDAGSVGGPGGRAGRLGSVAGRPARPARRAGGFADRDRARPGRGARHPARRAGGSTTRDRLGRAGAGRGGAAATPGRLARRDSRVRAPAIVSGERGSDPAGRPRSARGARRRRWAGPRRGPDPPARWRCRRTDGSRRGRDGSTRRGALDRESAVARRGSARSRLSVRGNPAARAGEPDRAPRDGPCLGRADLAHPRRPRRRDGRRCPARARPPIATRRGPAGSTSWPSSRISIDGPSCAGPRPATSLVRGRRSSRPRARLSPIQRCRSDERCAGRSAGAERDRPGRRAVQPLRRRQAGGVRRRRDAPRGGHRRASGPWRPTWSSSSPQAMSEILADDPLVRVAPDPEPFGGPLIGLLAGLEAVDAAARRRRQAATCRRLRAEVVDLMLRTLDRGRRCLRGGGARATRAAWSRCRPSSGPAPRPTSPGGSWPTASEACAACSSGFRPASSTRPTWRPLDPDGATPLRRRQAADLDG